MTAKRQAIAFWLAVGAIGFLCVPWYALEPSVMSTGWLRDFTNKNSASGLLQVWRHGRTWLLPVGLLLLSGGALLLPRLDRNARAHGLLALGAIGFVYTLGQGFAIGPQGWSFEALSDAWGPIAGKQYGME